MIGAPGYDAMGAAGQTLQDAGAVYVFTWNGLDWQNERLTPSNAGTDHRFGFAVDIDEGNGNTIVVGAPGAATAYIFERDPAMNPPRWIETATLTYSGTVEAEQFGWSVAISQNYALVGAPYADAGTALDRGVAQVHWRHDAMYTWGWVERLASAQTGSRFGHDVSIVADEWIIVGAPGGDNLPGDTVVQPGLAYVYRQDSAIDWPLHRVITATQQEDYAEFGWSVDIGFTAVGINAVIGAPYHDGDLAAPITNVGIVEFCENIEESP